MRKKYEFTLNIFKGNNCDLKKGEHTVISASYLQPTRAKAEIEFEKLLKDLEKNNYNYESYSHPHHSESLKYFRTKTWKNKKKKK